MKPGAGAAPVRAVLAFGRAIAVLDCGHVTGVRFAADGAKMRALACEWCGINADKALKDHGLERGAGL